MQLPSASSWNSSRVGLNDGGEGPPSGGLAARGGGLTVGAPRDPASPPARSGAGADRFPPGSALLTRPATRAGAGEKGAGWRGGSAPGREL